MNPEFTLTLSIAQFVMVGGLIWGVARMSKSVDTLREVTEKLGQGLDRLAQSLADIVTRVGILEDRSERRRSIGEK